MDGLPIVYLRDVAFSELQWLVQFIYSGRTDVPGHRLQAFLALAREEGVGGRDNRMRESESANLF